MVDIHNYKKRLERTLEKVKNSNISKQNKKDIFDFHNFCFSIGIGHAKIQRYVFDLEKIAGLLKKDFRKCKKGDIQKIIIELEKTDYSPETKRGLRIALKKFFKWLRGTEDKGVYPEEVKWISTTNKNNNHKLPEDLLTEEEIIQMINYAKNERDKAFISVLYESGCRAGEILTLKIKNISFDELGAKITVSGKTGSRRIRLVSSEAYLKEWLNKHPDKDNPEAFVWVRENSKDELVGYTRVRQLLSKIAKKSGVKKSVNPHSFRHARASYLANFLTEAQLKEVFGWTQASKMASIYVHLSGRDTDKAILKVYGKKLKDEKDTKSLLTPKVCPRCKTTNEATNIFCKRCGIPLDEKTRNEIIKQEIERKESDKVMNELVKDKEILKLLIEKIKKLRLVK